MQTAPRMPPGALRESHLRVADLRKTQVRLSRLPPMTENEKSLEALFGSNKPSSDGQSARRGIHAPTPGREAYLAGYHAAQALISERTGHAVKSHGGAKTEFHRPHQS